MTSRHLNVNVALALDGVSPGYTFNLNSVQRTTSFEGFVNNVKGQLRLARFKFGNAQQPSGEQTTSHASAAAPDGTGVVNLKIHSAVESLAAPRTHTSTYHAAGKSGLKEGAPVSS